MTVKRKEVFFFDGKTAECVLASDYDALRQENERLVAANKARAEYLTTRRAGNDVDSYVNLAEAEIAALRLQLTDALNRQTCEGGQPYVCHALATARSRLADWHRMADERSAEIVRLSTRLAEADALLLMTKWSVLCVAEDAYRAHRLDISDSQYALLNRIDAFRAADSATNRENERE